jgi:hypothetical protein
MDGKTIPILNDDRTMELFENPSKELRRARIWSQHQNFLCGAWPGIFPTRPSATSAQRNLQRKSMLSAIRVTLHPMDCTADEFGAAVMKQTLQVGRIYWRHSRPGDH